MDFTYVKNEAWDAARPFMTVMTPLYNRRATILRTMRSVDAQTFRDIEYIIIDDGSTEPSDDIVREFMDATDLPVLFIKKTNGGVHTARNEGYRRARGTLVLGVDSDDELLPSACAVFHDAWFSIPEAERKDYWQMKALDKDYQTGKILSSQFPENINRLPLREAYRYFSLAKGDQIGCRVASIMKENLFPEPEGVTMVTENIVWLPMEQRYRSFGINEAVYLCHTEGDDHISTSLNKTKRKATLQDCRNTYWTAAYMANHRDIFAPEFPAYLKKIVRSCQMAHLLWKTDRDFVKQNPLRGGGRGSGRRWYGFPPVFWPHSTEKAVCDAVCNQTTRAREFLPRPYFFRCPRQCFSSLNVLRL